MSSRDNARRPRAEILADLARVGRDHSDTTVLYHEAVARRLSLNPTDYKTMSVLERMGPLSAGEISRHTGLATASVTDLLDRLEAKGYVTRARDAADRRRVAIHLVQAKIKEARRYIGSSSESLRALYGEYTDAELSLLADFLQRNATRLRDEIERLKHLEGLD